MTTPHWDPRGQRWLRKARPISARVTIIEDRADGYAAGFKHLKFLVSEAREEDGRWWLHASVSRRDRKLPTYEDLRSLKELTIGPDRTAIQVFPPAERHIDVGARLPNPIEVLHLWSPEEDFLPDFARGSNSI